VKNVLENRTKDHWDSVSGALQFGGTLNSGPQPAGPAWYAIQTLHQWEDKVTSFLGNKDVESYLPVWKEIHQWSDRKKVIRRPLFSGYTFARLILNPNVRKAVLVTNGVIDFVGSSGAACAIPQKQIDDLQQVLSQSLPCTLSPFLRTGQRVRVREGCLRGVEGVVTKNNPKHLVLSIDLIEKSLTIEIQGFEVELV